MDFHGGLFSKIQQENNERCPSEQYKGNLKADFLEEVSMASRPGPKLIFNRNENEELPCLRVRRTVFLGSPQKRSENLRKSRENIADLQQSDFDSDRVVL